MMSEEMKKDTTAEDTAEKNISDTEAAAADGAEETAEKAEPETDTEAADTAAEENPDSGNDEGDKAAGGKASEDAGAEDKGADEQKSSAEDDLKKAEKKAADAEDRYMRLMAEFQNYKKRVAREKQDIRSFANEKIVTELLQVIDSFERALENDPSADAEAYAKGMSLIYEQLKKALTDAGLEEIESLGEDFDPKLHNAVMTQESEEYESGKVVNVLQKGYKLNSKVIRPAMVAVSK